MFIFFKLVKLGGAVVAVEDFVVWGQENTVQRAVGYAVESYVRVKLSELRILVNFIVTVV